MVQQQWINRMIQNHPIMACQSGFCGFMFMIPEDLDITSAGFHTAPST